LAEKSINLELHVKYKDLEVKFTGTPDDVIRSFLKYVRQVLPGYELISGLTLTADLEDMLKRVKGLIAFTPEGIVVTAPREKLGGEREVILLHLVKAYVGYKTGRLEKDSLMTSEIMSLTGGKSGSVAARLSELTSLGWVERVGRGEYRMTTLGVKAFLDEVLPKIKPEGTP
jgi:hypothetical protein